MFLFGEALYKCTIANFRFSPNLSRTIIVSFFAFWLFIFVRRTLAEKMSEDEEWTPPTEAELKVLDISKSPMAIASVNMGCYFLLI